MAVLTERRHPGEFIMVEGNGNISREALKIAADQAVEPNMVLGKRAVVADVSAAASAGAGNTGNATIAMGTPAVTTKVKDGRYKGIAVTATTVRWEDPEGKEIGVSTHGAEFSNGGIKFTITAGGVANVAGDEFYVDVAADRDDFVYVPLDLDATDGTEVAAAIAIYGIVTPETETGKVTGIVRLATVNGNCIAWPEGITDAQKADAIQALAAQNIIVR